MEVICGSAIRTTSTGDEEITYDSCLVELGTRCHGGAATWVPVAQECVGYTQLEATLNCYLRPDQFDALPSVPSLKSQGCEVFVVSRDEGVLKEVVGLDAIRDLASFRLV